jgi:hypothetical protein
MLQGENPLGQMALDYRSRPIGRSLVLHAGCPRTAYMRS